MICRFSSHLLFDVAGSVSIVVLVFVAQVFGTLFVAENGIKSNCILAKTDNN